MPVHWGLIGAELRASRVFSSEKTPESVLLATPPPAAPATLPATVSALSETEASPESGTKLLIPPPSPPAELPAIVLLVILSVAVEPSEGRVVDPTASLRGVVAADR